METGEQALVLGTELGAGGLSMSGWLGDAVVVQGKCNGATVSEGVRIAFICTSLDTSSALLETLLPLQGLRALHF